MLILATHNCIVSSSPFYYSSRKLYFTIWNYQFLGPEIPGTAWSQLVYIRKAAVEDSP